MRYMMLVYSTEPPGGLSAAEADELRDAHRRVMADATHRGILEGAEPLAPTSTATTVRVREGQAFVTDGPFAETKEHLAGYYILDCADLDEAIEWAARIPTRCRGGDGCIEIRPMPGLRKPEPENASACYPAVVNG